MTASLMTLLAIFLLELQLAMEIYSVFPLTNSFFTFLIPLGKSKHTTTKWSGTNKFSYHLPVSWFSIKALEGMFSTRGLGGSAGGSVGAGPKAVSLLRRISRALPII